MAIQASLKLYDGALLEVNGAVFQYENGFITLVSGTPGAPAESSVGYDATSPVLPEGKMTVGQLVERYGSLTGKLINLHQSEWFSESDLICAIAEVDSNTAVPMPILVVPVGWHATTAMWINRSDIVSLFDGEELVIPQEGAPAQTLSE